MGFNVESGEYQPNCGLTIGIRQFDALSSSSHPEPRIAEAPSSNTPSMSGSKICLLALRQYRFPCKTQNSVPPITLLPSVPSPTFLLPCMFFSPTFYLFSQPDATSPLPLPYSLNERVCSDPCLWHASENDMSGFLERQCIPYLSMQPAPKKKSIE